WWLARHRRRTERWHRRDCLAATPAADDPYGSGRLMLSADTLRHRAAARPRRALVGRAGRVAMGLAAVVAAIVSLRTSDASHGFSYLTESATSAVIGLTAGWGLVAVGLETVRRWRRPRFGYLLAAAGIAWFLPEWADPAIGVSV